MLSESLFRGFTVTRYQKAIVFFLIAMMLFTVSRGLLYVTYPDQFSSLGPWALISAFANGTRFDGAVVARVFAIPLLLMTLPGRFFEHRIWFEPLAWLTYALTLAMVFLLQADIVYYGYVMRHVAYELTQIGNDLGFVREFAVHGYLGALVGFLLFAVALGWVWRRIVRMQNRPSCWGAPKYLLLFVALLLVGRGGPTGKVVEIIDAYGTGNTAYGNLSLNGNFTAMVFALNLNDVNHSFYPERKAREYLRTLRQVKYPDYPMVTHYDGDPTGYNVVFVLLESWNFDFTDGFSAEERGITPNFARLATDGRRFVNFYAAGQRSIEGIQATLTGIPPLEGLPRLDAGIGVSAITRLGSIANRHGYSTIFIQSSARDSFKVDGIARAAGFRDYYGKQDIPLRLNYPAPERAVFGWDYDMFMFLKEKLDGLRPPFLAYAFTGTTHTPYPPLPERFEVRRPNQPEGINGYLNTLHYADWSIGQFMNAARKSPWFDDTIFIFTADHASRWQQGDHLQRFHTPFLIYAPGIIQSGTESIVGSQLDVMPTIIDLLGFDDPFAALGESLFRKQHGYAFVTDGSTIGLITADSYLTHNLKRRLHSVSLNGKADSGRLALDEHRLLALDQLSFELLRENRWAPR